MTNNATPRFLTALALAALASSIPATSDALVAPLTRVDDTYFVARVEGVQVASAFIDIAPAGDRWRIDVEVLVRNIGIGPVSVDLAILDEAAFTSETLVFVDGVATRTIGFDPRQDPAFPEHTYRHARRLPLSLDLDGEVTVRARVFRTTTMDTLGRAFVELPTHALGLFSDPVTAGRIHLALRERALGLEATIDGTVYDEPLNDATWMLRDWNPRVPFRVSYSTPWAALLLVAEVEACPDPWHVVRSTTQGQISALRSNLQSYDDATLTFCGNLPDVLHGRPFTNEQTREQLAAITLDRYVPGSRSVPLYVPNANWSDALLSDAEAIYAHTLRSVLAERSPR